MPPGHTGEWRYSSTILDLGIRWSASRPGRFIPGEISLGTHWIGGWVAREPVWTLWGRDRSCPWRGYPDIYIYLFEILLTATV
jgi:hypothetical protein